MVRDFQLIFCFFVNDISKLARGIPRSLPNLTFLACWSVIGMHLVATRRRYDSWRVIGRNKILTLKNLYMADTSINQKFMCLGMSVQS